MKLYNNSLCHSILKLIYSYGNFPYSSLKLLKGNYESTKDAVQKLIHAGYVAVIKAHHLKSMYVTPSGCTALEKSAKGISSIPTKGNIVYHPPKAERAGRIHEASFLFSQAGIGDYRNCLEIKRQMESEQPRSTDSLKYSRFVGYCPSGDFGLLVYHFGWRNNQLNNNGEENAVELARSYFKSRPHDFGCPILILGDSMDTLLSILRYSEKINSKTHKQLKYFKSTHYWFNFNKGWTTEDTFFLPVAVPSIQILPLLRQSNDWNTVSEKFKTFYSEKFPKHEVFSMLDCRIKYILWLHRSFELVRYDKILILCYDWQEKFIRGYFAAIASQREFYIQAIPTQTMVSVFSGIATSVPTDPCRIEPGEDVFHV